MLSVFSRLMVAATRWRLWIIKALRNSTAERSGFSVRGIRNNGNTCYANVVLQSLASLPEFVESLELWRMIANEELAPVASELLRVLQSLRQRGETPALPWAADLSALLSLVRGSRLGQRFTAGDQHDALEFLQTLLALVDQEAAQVAAFRAPIGDFGPAALRLSLTIGSIGASRSPPLRRIPPPCPLSGLVSMQLVCKHCGFAKPTRHEEFTHLSLPLTSDLHSSLAALLGSEEVLEVECPQCSISTAVLRVKNRLDLATSLADMDGDDGCNVGRIESMRRVHTLLNGSCRQGETDTFCADVGDSAQLPLSLLDLNEPLIPERRPMLKSTTLSRLPVVLCCHFVRMRGDGLKARGRVNFPLKLSFVSGPDGFSLLPEPRSRRNLDESQTQTPGTAVLRYALHAVIQHAGSDLAGHYTAFGLCLGNRLAAEWAHFNDHRWAYAKAEQVSGADDVSMLIYARFQLQ